MICFITLYNDLLRLAKKIDQVDAQIKQSQAGFYPILSLQASTSQQAESTDPLAKGLLSTSQTTTSIHLSQNLFQGFRDVHAVHQRDQLKRGTEWGKKQTIQQLYKDVSLMGAAKKSGRARDSDLVIAESSVANLEAAISGANGQLAGYFESFAFLTGLTQEVKLINTTQLPKELKNSESWLLDSDLRPDIQKSKFELSAAEIGIESARSGHFPNLGLTANYYLSRPSRPGKEPLQEVDWDAGLILSLPVFSGGLTKAQVGEAVMNMLKESHIENKTTIILVTHEPEYAKRADRQVNLADGKIVSDAMLPLSTSSLNRDTISDSKDR